MYFNEEQTRIVLLVQKGHTNAEIGDELGYSAECIKKKTQENLQITRR